MDQALNILRIIVLGLVFASTVAFVIILRMPLNLIAK